MLKKLPEAGWPFKFLCVNAELFQDFSRSFFIFSRTISKENEILYNVRRININFNSRVTGKRKT